MALQQRNHVPGGTYYILRRTYSQRPVFSHPDDYALLENLLPVVSKRSGVQVLGYCWMRDAFHLALQITEMPVGNFMRNLTGHYSQHVHRRTGERGQLFRRRYQATLIDPSAFLPKLIHYLHYLPVVADLVQHPGDYPHSSHHAYLGSVYVPWLNTRPLLRLIDDFDEGRITYRRLMAEAPLATIGALLERGHADTLGILGNRQFIAVLPRRARPSQSTRTLDQIAALVARSHGVLHEHLVSRSRRRELVLARAQITWYVVERRVASLREVARYLRHTASSLTRAITRIQRRQPELLTMDAFASMAPLIPLSLGSHNRPGNGDAVLRDQEYDDAADSCT